MATAEIIKLVLKLSLFLTALGYGLKASPADAVYLFRKPGQLLRSVLAMNVMMPLFAILIAISFELAHLVKVTLVAIAVSPLASLFPGKPVKAGGHAAYVIGLMVATSLFSILLIPLTLRFLEFVLLKPVGFSIGAIVVTVLLTVIIPLLSGIAIRYFFSAFTEKYAPAIARVALFLLILSVLPVLFMVLPGVKNLIGNGTVLAIAVFVAAGILSGHFFGGPAPADRTVLALATASRHPAIAISLASANLPEHELIPATILLYLLINAVMTLLYLKVRLKMG